MEGTLIRTVAFALLASLAGAALAAQDGSGILPGGRSLGEGWSLADAYGSEPSASAATLSLPALSRASQGGLLFAERPGFLETRAGPLFFIDDFEGMSPGFEIDGVFGFHPVSFLALEASSGYFWGEDDGGGADDGQLWGIPLEARAVVEIPLFLSPYVGAGAGYYYLSTDAPGAEDESDFIFGWNAVLGIRLALGPVLLGVEGKYVYTDVADTVWGQDRLEGIALFGSLGMAF